MYENVHKLSPTKQLKNIHEFDETTGRHKRRKT